MDIYMYRFKYFSRQSLKYVFVYESLSFVCVVAYQPHSLAAMLETNNSEWSKARSSNSYHILFFQAAAFREGKGLLW